MRFTMGLKFELTSRFMREGSSFEMIYMYSDENLMRDMTSFSTSGSDSLDSSF